MLKEAFEWAPGGALSKSNLLKLVAKTETTTVHPEDPIYTNRKFCSEELRRAARTLIGRPVGRNHEEMPIYGAYVLDSEFNEDRVESIAYAPTLWIDKVRTGLIKNCSIEYTWRDEKRSDHTVEFEGLVFTRIDLLEGLQPGDPNSTVKLFEAEKKTGILLTEVEAIGEKTLGEPFAGYADFDACVLANQDKEDPEAYCAVIKAQTETDGKVKEVEAALLRVTTELQNNKISTEQQISDAKRQEASGLRAAIEAVLPKNVFNRDTKLVKLIKDIRTVLCELDTKT